MRILEARVKTAYRFVLIEKNNSFTLIIYISNFIRALYYGNRFVKRAFW